MANPNQNESSGPSAGVEELSRLLLQGWTMLAESCPRVGCNMPLMRSRQGRVVCCHCRADIVNNDDRRNGHAHMNGTREVKEDKNKSDSDNANDDNQHDIDTTTTTDDNNNTSNEDSNNDSEPVESRVVVPATPATSRSAAMSAALGDKLLQGWTLLRDACVSCGTPLVRNHIGVVSCVSCGTSITTGSPSGAGPSAAATTAAVTLPNTTNPAVGTTNAITRTRNALAAPTPTTIANSLSNATNSIHHGQQLVQHSNTSAATTTTAAQTANTAGNAINRPMTTATAAPTRAATTRTATAATNPTTRTATQHHHHHHHRQARIEDLNSANAGVDMTQATDHITCTPMDIDVDEELRMAELAAAHNLQVLRLGLPVSRDAQGRQAICAAMTESIKTIEAVRKALQARIRIV